MIVEPSVTEAGNFYHISTFDSTPLQVGLRKILDLPARSRSGEGRAVTFHGPKSRRETLVRQFCDKVHNP
jgi:hypothetical protein